jgi:hypothetical protein
MLPTTCTWPCQKNLVAALQVVIAFRGTASLANVKADMQVWRTGWPPGVGQGLLCT